MGAWLSNVSLKYKFWAVNAVAFVTTLLLVLYAVHLEQRARAEAAQAQAAAQAQLLAAWPAGQHCHARPTSSVGQPGKRQPTPGRRSMPCATPKAG